MVNSCCAFNCTQRSKKGSGISFHSFPKNEELRRKWVIATRRENFVPTVATTICSLHFQKSDFCYNFGQKKLRAGCVPSIFNFVPQAAARSRKRIFKVDTNAQTEEVKNVENSSRVEEATHLNVKTSCKNTQTSSPPNIDPPCELRTRNEEISIQSARKPQELPPKVERIYCQIDASTLQLPRVNFIFVDPIVNYGTRSRRTFYFGDFRETDLQNPEKVRNMWLSAKRTIEKQKRKIKFLQSRTYKLERKFNKLQDKMQVLKNSRKPAAGDLAKPKILKSKSEHSYALVRRARSSKKKLDQSAAQNCKDRSDHSYALLE